MIIMVAIMVVMIVIIIIVIIRCYLASFWVDISVTMVVVTAITPRHFASAAGTLEPTENSNGK